MKNRILYILLGVILLSKVGMGQTLTSNAVANTICSGDNFNIQMSFNQRITFFLEYNLNDGSGWHPYNAFSVTSSNSNPSLYPFNSITLPLVSTVSVVDFRIRYSTGTTYLAGSSTTTSILLSITVNPRPTATLTLSPSPIGKNPICLGEDVSLRLDVVSSGSWSLTLSDNSVASGVFSRTDFTPSRPNSNTTYSITALSDANCTSISSDLTGSITVNVDVLSVGGLIGGSTTVCTGTNSATLTLSGNTGSVTKWQSSTDAAFTTPEDIVNTTSSYSPSNLTSKLFYRAVVKNGVCAATNSSNADISINPLPAKPALTNQTICEGVTATIIGPTGTYTYNWQVPTGVATSTTKTVNTTKAGTYSLTITDANSCTSEVGIATVVVNALPAKPTLTSPKICEGDTASVTMFTPRGTSTYTYTWTVPTGVATSTTKTISTSKAGTYSLTITDANSCTSEVGTGIVTVNTLPAKPTLTSPKICEGDTASVTMLTPTGTSTYTYTWTVPTGVATSTTKTVSTSKAGTYSLTITDANSCTSEVATGTVVVNALPPRPTLTSPVICEGETATVTMSTPTGASTYTYTWTVPTGVATSTTKTVSTSKAGTYSLTIMDANSCTSEVGTGTVVVNALPPKPTLTSPVICEGETATVTMLTPTGTSTYIYTWQVPTGVATSTTKTVSTTKAGTYSLTIINDKGCKSADASGTVTVNPIPAVPIISSNSPICEGASLNLVTTNVSGATYSWTGPNNYTSSLINPIINNANSLAAGNYSLKITTNGCSSPLSTPMNVIINATPTAPTVSSNSPIEEEKTLNLTASTLTGASYAWSGPNGFASIQQNPSITGATPANSGKYYATVTLNGCTSVSSLPINVLVNAKVLSSPVFQIPNAFTPNSDGHNDTFKIIENGYVTSIKEFKIFTKSGKLIFSDKDGAWDGRYAGVMLDSDVYIWIADFMNKNNIQEHLSGTVLLLK